MKKTIIISFILLASFGTAFSQTIFTLSYEPATPLGEMRDFIGKTSFRGLSASGNWFLGKKITLGATIQWTGFYEKVDRETFEIEGSAITSTVWKEFYILPLYVNAKYHFLEEGMFLPYAGLSAGASYIEQLAQVGTFEFTEIHWRFGLAPEVGTLIPMGIEKSWGLNVMLRYQMAFYNEFDINLLQYLNYSFGVYWKLYPRGERY